MFNRFQVSKWHLSRQHLSMWHLSISGLYQLFLTWLWSNFKSRFLGASLTDASCRSDICPNQSLGFTWKWLGTPPPPPPTTGNSMLTISQLLLARFWPNFKHRFLGPSLTHPNCHGDICPGNICPVDICPYREYLSCYWPDFDQTLEVGWQV